MEQNKAIYIATIEANSGKSIVALGLMHLLLGRMARVGYFRPIINDYPEGEQDNHIATILSYFKIPMQYEEAYACTRSEVVQKNSRNQEDQVLDKIISKFKAVESKFDFVLVEGTDFVGEGAIIEWDFNVLIAKNLGIPAIIISSGRGKTIEEFENSFVLACDSFADRGVKVLMVVANKVQPENRELVIERLEKELPGDILIGAIPNNPALSNPSIREIVSALEGTVLFGDAHLDNQAGHFGVGAMQLRNYLTHMGENSLVITPGDRADIILGALQAHISKNYPSVSGIFLTGGLIPEDSIIRLIEGLSEVVPIISVQEGTYNATNKVAAVKPRIYPENHKKIARSLKDFTRYMPEDSLAERLVTFRANGITPRMFQYNLLKMAQAQVKRIVLPEGTDERILRATRDLIQIQAVEITLLGNAGEIRKMVALKGIDLDLEKVQIIDPRNSPDAEDYANTLYELRKHKNMDPATARDLMEDVSYYGTMMVYKGHADGMVSGAMHTTQHTIRPALQFVKTRPEVSLVSSVFFMLLADRVVVFGDCAINPNPTAEELAAIAITSADTTIAFGLEARIAMLSYSSGSSGQGADVDRVREATALVRKERPDLLVEGPIQYDAAVDPKVGRSKLPDSEVAGRATVFVFPDLNTGNNTYKAVQRETGALAIGPVLQGLNKPVNDLSRGCTEEDVFNTVVITAIQAQRA
ncbi:phosphate acetyltransferase [Robiginitalea aurantiaca]|uniref:Phosphate acetyltransferase n=1 Tax=Robiginitalea aurantiaca TaxID=3056915 RepID=A0ABT7WH87_9FLAO|nr:phosphate acetyltransferase [Robiginitalea aurantiaca]MDM9632275.1 phosphate acetyltransferase [Robiginitalea aurantiaca]